MLPQPFSEPFSPQIEQLGALKSKTVDGFIGDTPSPLFLNILTDDYCHNLSRFFDEETGTVHEAMRDDGTPAFLFSEVTGYAIHDLLLLYALTGETFYVDQAQKAATWLTNTAWHPDGWIQTRFYFEHDENEELGLYSFAGGNIFSFDNGICLGGLVALYKVQPAPKLLVDIHTLADHLVELIGPDGSIPPIINLHQKVKGIEHPPRWSQQSGSFHTKVAEALADVYSLTQDEQYAEAAQQICTFALSFQREDGRFITDPTRKLTQLHPHCYTAEGLLHVGTVLDRSDFIQAALRATQWALSQYQEGGIAQEICTEGSWGQFQRTDALAQVLRLGGHLYRLGHNGLDWQCLCDLARDLWSMKDTTRGYFRYGWYENGEESSTLSYWTNMFAFHGLLEFLAAWVSKHTSVVVLAGGIGSRCWPISCENLPKPLSRSFLGDRSLLEETISRFVRTGCIQPQNLYVVSTSQGLEETSTQMKQLGVPTTNIIEEQNPIGTLPALRLAIQHEFNHETQFIAVSMSDNLIEPLPTFRDALMRAVLAEWWDAQGMVISLGVASEQWDSKFGHGIYDASQPILTGVFPLQEFVEKPSTAPQYQPGYSMAWESGCIVTKLDYLRELLVQLEDHTLPNHRDISYALLENPQVRKGVSLYASSVRFADLGTPGRMLLQFFQGTRAEKADGNLVLGTKSSDVVFLNAHHNIVISGSLPIEIVGISDHLIIDNDFANTAVIMPLDQVDALPTLYRMLQDPESYRPFVVGGEDAHRASPHHTAHQCQDRSIVSSKHGLAIASHCTNIRFQRSTQRLCAMDISHIDLTDFEVDILLTKRSDSRMIHHLMDVTIVADMMANSVGLSQEARELLHLLCLTHDIGGFLTDEEIQAERELVELIHKISGLDWTRIDSKVIEKLIMTAPEAQLMPKQLELLPRFHDSIQSALDVLDIKSLRSHPHLDELLFLLCNQERPDQFRRPFSSKFKLDPGCMANIYACFKIAETWIYTHCLWRKKLRPWSREDIAQSIALICRELHEADIGPHPFIRHLNQMILTTGRTSLLQYTCEKLRLIEGSDGHFQSVPLYTSDQVYLAFMQCVQTNSILDDRVTASIIDALQTGHPFEQDLLLRLPAQLEVLAATNVIPINLVKELAFKIITITYQDQPDLWSYSNEARNSLLKVLQS